MGDDLDTVWLADTTPDFEGSPPEVNLFGVLPLNDISFPHMKYVYHAQNDQIYQKIIHTLLKITINSSSCVPYIYGERGFYLNRIQKVLSSECARIVRIGDKEIGA